MKTILKMTSGKLNLLVIVMAIIFLWSCDKDQDLEEMKIEEEEEIIDIADFTRDTRWNESFNLDGTTFEYAYTKIDGIRSSTLWNISGGVTPMKTEFFMNGKLEERIYTVKNAFVSGLSGDIVEWSNPEAGVGMFKSEFGEITIEDVSRVRMNEIQIITFVDGNYDIIVNQEGGESIRVTGNFDDIPFLN